MNNRSKEKIIEKIHALCDGQPHVINKSWLVAYLQNMVKFSP